MPPQNFDFQLRAIDGTRTRDPRLGKPMLYQLSHYRISFAKITHFSYPMKFCSHFLKHFTLFALH